MKRCTILFALSVAAAFAQSEAKFEIADVHVAAKVPNPNFRMVPPRNGRYEIHNATMVDLVRTAYAVDADKVLGGPSWLEMARFDVIAKVNSADLDSLKAALQSLLAERFKLVTHKDTRPLPTYALVQGRKPLLKEADGSGDTGCKLQTQPDPPPGTPGMSTIILNGTGIRIGPGGSIGYSCRNMTMEAFAAGLRNMFGANGVGPNPVVDRTGLKGMWNFDVRWTLQINMSPAVAAAANMGPPISVFDAIDKQLGLKLEQQQVPTPVIVVDSVSQTPTPNLPEVANSLPPIPVPTEFEVADIRPSAPDSTKFAMQTQPGGRFITEGTTMQSLLMRAFSNGSPLMSNDSVIGVPKWADTARFDITAKANVNAAAAFDLNTLTPLLRRLLEDRFHLKAHTEERPVSAYTLLAGKPKMKKADPNSRTHCIRANAPAGSPPGSQMLTFQNITMAQFAEQLMNSAPALLRWPVLDATAIEGGWDFTLLWSSVVPNMNGPGGGGDSAGAVASAADPNGGLTLFEAVEKQLGLKLEIQKRPMPVTVIDSLDEKPTDN